LIYLFIYQSEHFLWRLSTGILKTFQYDVALAAIGADSRRSTL